ncbi:ATP-binding cassette domain-containing protein [Nocardia sp. NBC_00565]|uniref:ABC transporter ATP-binding protein n=1 Tax=Nocardia sp. NBC_00565 TaxID=2975993 RepID=UPI002E815C30|nr:ATP-binding cassette domain-containing protein [Nocardia sp. NBC_00565]WUC07790.1 ATP-binding cassette domain-containing protein [Nocardia sp. NBC_00565]
MLECNSLSAGYFKDRPCVREVSLSIDSGQIVSLLGPNGAGKTTLLLTLAGLLPSLGGNVVLAGTAIAAGKARLAAKRGLVLVPDDRALFAGLSVADHLRLATSESSDIDRILGYFPALLNRWKVAAGQLSGGEQQMLAIGRALALKPRALLIDELSMGLAPIAVESILPVIKQVAVEENIAVLLVEQHVKLALSVADRAVVLVKGRIVVNSDAAELLRHPDIVEAAYLGVNHEPDAAIVG